MKKRDDFTQSTKDRLGHRVAWVCSWPGCNVVTIGPKKTSTRDFQRLGDAAHIHAAAKGGPRYDPNMSEEARKSIENGIWMCKHHARLIDNDYKEYSADTLRKWKASAEEVAYKALCLPGELYSRELSTLIQIGNDIVFHGRWLSADENKGEWTVVVKDYVYGDEYLLKEFCSKYKNRKDNYIVIEDQGDGRTIKCAPFWKYNEESVICLTVNVGQKLLRTNPATAGVDIALSSSWDFILDKSGDIAIVRGIDSAKQRISTSLSTRFGEVLFDSQAGSFFYKYFCDYKERDVLLSSLLKLEVARLASLPVEGRERSPLGFVNRVIDVIFDDLNIINNDKKISVILKIEWGDGEITSDKYWVFVGNCK